MLEDFSQVEIAQQLGTSQSTVCRDMVALDADAERRSHFVREISFKFNIVWNTHLDIDRLVKEALESYARLDASDLKGRTSMLRVVTGLLARRSTFSSTWDATHRTTTGTISNASSSR